MKIWSHAMYIKDKERVFNVFHCIPCITSVKIPQIHKHKETNKL